MEEIIKLYQLLGISGTVFILIIFFIFSVLSAIFKEGIPVFFNWITKRKTIEITAANERTKLKLKSNLEKENEELTQKFNFENLMLEKLTQICEQLKSTELILSNDITKRNLKEEEFEIKLTEIKDDLSTQADIFLAFYQRQKACIDLAQKDEVDL